jgi:hypothetical protein
MFVRHASSFALISTLALGAPSIALADTAARPIAAHVESTRTPAPAHEGTRDYAQREAKDKVVENYQGGNTVVIAMSGGAFVVLILLLLLI